MFYLKEIDVMWGDALKTNSTIKFLTLKNGRNDYDFGEQFWMGLKRRQVKFTRVKLKNTFLDDQTLYYFLAFVRSCHQITRFTLWNAFDAVKPKLKGNLEL